MSTVTKIKGVIDNYSLPVITPEGLLPYWQGVFVNKLAEKNYTLSTRQKNAISTFLSEISEDDVVNTVRHLWPFIGNSDTPDAAKVPLIGGKDYDFGDSFTDISYNVNQEIIGLTDIPEIPSLNVMDFCDSHQINIAASSIIKPLSSISLSENRMFMPVRFQDDVTQFRAIQYDSSKKFIFGLYVRQVSTGIGLAFSPVVAENTEDGGNLYTMFGLNDHSTIPYYNRYERINNSPAKKAAGTDISRVYAPPLPEDAGKTLVSLVASAQKEFLIAFTGLVVFNRILSDSEMDIFMNAWKKMNIALGKEASV